MSHDDGSRPAATDGSLEALVAREQSGSRVPSIAVATAQAGEPYGVAVAGLADVEGGIAAVATTPYRIGSITKTFTAALVLSLADEGHIALDAHVERYLPDTPLGEVPLRSLLAHCGGVQREAPVDMWRSMQGPDRQELREAFGRARLVDRPGARWHYSNLGYAVLGEIVREVTALDCEDLIDERLIGPLGLKATSWTRPAGAAVGYRVDPYSDLVHREPDMDQARVGVGGQLWSTVGDLLVWGDALAGGAPEVVSPAVVDAMHTLHVMVDTATWMSAWGLGLILERSGDLVTSGHTGAMPGFVAALSIERSTRSVAVALSNATRGAGVGRLAAERVRELVDSAPAPSPVPWVPAEQVPAELEGVLGRWWSEADETVFTWRPDGLHAQLVGGPPAGESRFEQVLADVFRTVAGRFNGEHLMVRRDAEGAVVELEWATYPFTRAPR